MPPKAKGHKTNNNPVFFTETQTPTVTATTSPPTPLTVIDSFTIIADVHRADVSNAMAMKLPTSRTTSLLLACHCQPRTLARLRPRRLDLATPLLSLSLTLVESTVYNDCIIYLKCVLLEEVNKNLKLFNICTDIFFLHCNII